MKPSRAVVTSLGVFTAAFSLVVHAAEAPPRVAPWVLEKTAGGKTAEFLVVLADQADLSGADSIPTKGEKGRFVRDALFSKAEKTQWPIRAWLAERGIAHRGFYIVNALLVTGDRGVVDALAARDDVARIEGNPTI